MVLYFSLLILHDETHSLCIRTDVSEARNGADDLDLGGAVLQVARLQVRERREQSVLYRAHLVVVPAAPWHTRFI